MSDRRTVLFRVDAGRVPGLSFGHVFRCLVLADELRLKYGVAGRFLMRAVPSGPEVVRDRGYEVVILPEDASFVWPRDVDLWVVDLPSSRAEPLPVSGGIPVAVIDDRGEFPPGTALGICGAIEAPPLPTEGTVLAGPHYAVISPEFAARRRVRDGAARRLLVTFGGSDPADLTLAAMRELVALGEFPATDVLTGPGYAADGALAELAGAATCPVRRLRNAASLAALLPDYDLAVCAAGVTAYEMAANGLPAVLVPSIGHERAAAAAFDRQGCARSCDPSGTDWGPVFRRTLTDLIGSPAIRHRMSVRGPEVVDGRGGVRVAAALARKLRVEFQT